MGEALKGKHVLLLEDEYFQAADLQNILESEDIRVSGPASRVSDALGILGQEQVDAAILDVNVAGEKCYPVADWLVQRRIPFLFLTGYDGRHLPPAYRDVMRLSKPASAEQLLGGVCQLFKQ
jgi:CheY-like chemotaxis protein